MLGAMNIYEFFATFTKLPIRIDTVVEQLRSMGVVVDIRYFEVDTDPSLVGGICRVYRSKPCYSVDEHARAEIIYSGRLPEDWRRVVVCKELLHLIDGDEEMARTREQVDQLIEEIVIPQSLAKSLPTRSDKSGLLNALKILLPRDALVDLAKLHHEKRISVHDVATLAKIPEPFAAFALTPLWRRIVDGIN